MATLEKAMDNAACYNLWWCTTHSVWELDQLAALQIGYSQPGHGGGGIKSGVVMGWSQITIPKNSLIKTAYLNLWDFTNWTVNTVNSKILGVKEADYAISGTVAHYSARRGTVVGGYNNTLRTTAEVAWNSLPSFGPAYNPRQSPEIRTVIQEIVNQAQWVSGNHLGLFWDDHDGNSSTTNNAMRSVFSGNFPDTAYKPVLHVEYQAGDTPPFIPNDPTTRVTQLVRRFLVGPSPVYQLEGFLGGLSSEYFSPVANKGPKPTIPSFTQAPYDPTLSIDAVWRWLATIPPATLVKIFGHGPPYTHGEIQTFLQFGAGGGF